MCRTTLVFIGTADLERASQCQTDWLFQDRMPLDTALSFAYRVDQFSKGMALRASMSRSGLVRFRDTFDIEG